MNALYFKDILSRLPSAYALFKCTTENDPPTDYTFADINPAFEAFTGLALSDLQGEKISTIRPHTMTADFCWRDFYEALVSNSGQEAKQISDLSCFFLDDSYFVTLFNVTEPCISPVDKRKLKKSLQRHRILVDSLLKTFKDRQEQLDHSLRQALKLTDSQYGYIYLYDETREAFTLKSWATGVMANCQIVEKQTRYWLQETGIWGEVVRQRQPLIVNHFDDFHPQKKGYPQGHVHLRNFMTIPIFSDDQLVAVVGLGNKNTDYDDIDVHELTMLMNGIWVSVEKREIQNQANNLLARTQSMFNEHKAVMLLIKPEKGQIIDANLSALDFLGYSKKELLNMTIFEINRTDPKMIKSLLAQTLDNKKQFYTVSHQLKSGEYRLVEVYSSPINIKDQILHYAIIFDVTEREQALNEIKYLNYHDHLTDLYNRRYFDEALTQLNTPDQLPLGVIMADINGLKLINDSLGQQAGDQEIITVSQIIKHACDDTAIVARIGGDEFAVVLPHSDHLKAQKLIKEMKYLASLSQPEKITSSVAFGYAIKTDTKSSFNEILAEAENQMYRRKMYEGTSSRNQSVNIIMNALFEKSAREMDHSRRVGSIATLIAKTMNADAVIVQQIETAGFLHDIGKIGIDEQILNKPGKLDPFEWKEIQRHPEIGWRILGNTSDFSELSNIILNHHERWDGTGYPQGIAGPAIPLQSRIIALADSYDAMTNNRTYRRALTDSQAVEEIKRHSGKQFDPDLVSIFLENNIASCCAD